MKKQLRTVGMCLIMVTFIMTLSGCSHILAEIEHLNEIGMAAYQEEEKALKQASFHEYTPVEDGEVYLMAEYLRDDKVINNDGTIGSEVTLDYPSKVEPTWSHIKLIKAPEAPGYYFIQPGNTEFVWTVKDSGDSDKTPIVLANRATGKGSQLFSIADGGSEGIYTIQNKGSGKNLKNVNGKLVIDSCEDDSTWYYFKWQLILQD